MSDWLHNLPVVWMALVVFGFTYLVTAAIHVVVRVLAVGERPSCAASASPCDRCIRATSAIPGSNSATKINGP